MFQMDITRDLENWSVIACWGCPGPKNPSL